MRYRVHRITAPDYTSIDDVSREPIRTFNDHKDAEAFAVSNDPIVASLAYGVAIVDGERGIIEWGDMTTDFRGNVTEGEPKGQRR